MLKRLNDALPGLVMGILIYGAVLELAGVWFVSDKLRYTTGLMIGIALACGMAVNMAVVLQDAVDGYGESHAQAKIIAKSILRYVVVVIVFFLMMKFQLGNLCTAFLGVFGLKVSAYLQPVAHKWLSNSGDMRRRAGEKARRKRSGLSECQGRGDVSLDSEDTNI